MGMRRKQFSATASFLLLTLVAALFFNEGFVVVVTAMDDPPASITITSEELKAGIDSDAYDAWIDVRTQEEWDSGHIDGATLVANLASTGSPSELSGCESCTLAIYCNSGARAAQAILNLQNAGFTGQLYNGLGVTQWSAAGFALVTTPSVVPSCISTQMCMGTATTSTTPPASVTITSEDLKAGIDSGAYDALVDVRSQGEWDVGHIDGATLVANLASTGSPADLAGCESCTLAIYCNSGARAAQAIINLQNAGFTGQLYNGLGVSQWTTAGFELVNTASIVPSCISTQMCQASEEASQEENSSGSFLSLLFPCLLL